jgi:hypothetical protein
LSITIDARIAGRRLLVGNSRMTTRATLPSCVFHLAEAENWPSIQQHGLLSTSRLLAASGIEGTGALPSNGTHRLSRTVLPNGIVIRDQKPIPSEALRRCLVGMSPEEWYGMLNARVFFWLDHERLNRQRLACGPHRQVVMVLDTARLLAQHRDRIELTAINTGNARRKPALRGRATFVPYREWLASGWTSEATALGSSPRSRNHRPAELTVVDAVSDVMEFVTAVVELREGELLGRRI